MAFITVSEKRRDLFLLKADSCSDSISSSSSGSSSGHIRRVEVDSKVRKIASALNVMYGDKMEYKRAVVNRQIAHPIKVRSHSYRVE